MPQLPVELFPKIISTLVTPAHPFQIGHTTSVISTLRHLSLVNHFLRSLSTPHLYSSITIYTEDQLQALLQTYDSSIGLCNHTHSLAIHYFPYNVEVIHCLFYLLGPYLTHLAMFGIQAVDLGSSVLVRDALHQHCPNIEYFVLLENNSGLPPPHRTRCRPPYSFWPEFKTLNRLVLDDLLINSTEFVEFIAGLPCLTHLVLIDPKWSGGTPRLFEAGKFLKTFTLVLREVGRWYTNSLLKLGDFLNAGEGVDVRLVKLGREDVWSKGRIQEWVCCGMIWELDSNFFV